MNRLAWLWIGWAAAVQAQDARQIMEECQRRSRANSQRYEGSLKVIDARGRTSEKRWRYERLGSAGNSKAVIRFTAPAEVKGVALLVHNHPDRVSDQWMWRPAIARDQRVAVQDRGTRFFGTDFTFEDLEERDVDQYEYRLLGSETLEGEECWKIESRPKRSKSSQYTHSHVWVRKRNYTFAQIENFKRQGLVRRLRYRDMALVQGIWTARTLEMHDLERNSRTILYLEKLEYNVALSEDRFTLQALRRES
jgi:hypothetical protein